MKKLFVLFFLLLVCLTYSFAINTTTRYTHTYVDENGVIWHYIIYNNEALLSGRISGCGENVSVPRKVSDGAKNYTVTAICGNWFIYEDGSENWPYFPNTGVDFTEQVFGYSEDANIKKLFIPNTVRIVGSLPSMAEIEMESSEPPLGYKGDFEVIINNFLGIIKVPSASVASYRNATGWHLVASKIISSNAQTNYDIISTAKDASSGIYEKIEEDNLLNVISLKVTGSINSYDFFVLRTKMLNLRHLDLSDANIVANDYKYYENYCSKDNTITPYCLYTLFSIKLPRSIVSIEGPFGIGNITKEVVMYEGLKYIGPNSFSNYSFDELVLPNGLETIANDAFYNTKVENLILPEGLKTIGARAFYRNSAKNIAFPSTLIEIGNDAFAGCNDKKISLPTSLIKIGQGAFEGCPSLEELRIPSSVKEIGNNAFSGCPSLNNIYTYTIEPTTINQNTFDFRDVDVLHVPSTSYYNYYWHTQWGQFKHFVSFDDSYEYFYLNNDYTLDDNTGRIDGEPDADLNPGSGLIVEGNEDQDLDDVHVIDDGTSSGSIIGDGNIDANNLFFEKTIKKNQWYFFCFPYRIKIADIQCEGNWVFRWYDGEERANNGYGGWKHMPIAQEYLEPNQGYIFRCDRNTTLQIPVEKAQYGKFSGNDEQIALNHYPSSNAEDASWNFMGQPYPCYYDIDETNFDGPITVWNGTSYETVRPGDDEYQLSPFEGYFVQKPLGQSTMEFDSDGRHTYQQWDAIVEKKQQAPRRSPAQTGRYLINLTLTDGMTIDKTRVVYNEKCTTDYEIGTDAAKFMSDGVTQLYSLDTKQVRYSINERPMGEVCLGYVAPNAGTMIISGKRMDADVMLRDNQTGEVFDLSNGAYTFTTEAGTFDQRFTLLLAKSATGIKTVKADGEQSLIYTVDGKRVSETKTNQLYIKEGKKLINK